MIRKAVAVAGILFILYTLLIVIRPGWSASQNDRQENIIKAQRFVYDDSDTLRDVIVGSSLACHLAMDSLPGMYNLSFAGLSIFDGLRILEHRKNPPRRVFVEMNVVLKEEDKGFAASLFSPIPFYARKMLSSLRSDKQPIVLLGNSLLSFVKKSRRGPAKSPEQRDADEGRPAPEKSAGNPGSLFQKMLALQEADYAKDPDPEFLEERFRALSQYVSRLERRGVTVVFFEMPVNDRLCGLPGATVVRQSFSRSFPADKYRYIPSPPCSGFHTTDGVHLDGEEAARYTHYFREQRAER